MACCCCKGSSLFYISFLTSEKFLIYIQSLCAKKISFLGKTGRNPLVLRSHNGGLFFCLGGVPLSLSTLHLAEALHKESQKRLALLASGEFRSGENIIPYLFLHKYVTAGSVLKPGHVRFEPVCLHRWCWCALARLTSVPPGMLHANMCIVYIGICSVKTIDLILGDTV